MFLRQSGAVTAAAIAMSSTSLVGFPPVYGATPNGNAPLTLEEIQAKRQSVREDLMVPSLAGLRGIAYIVLPPEGDGTDYDKILEDKFQQLKIPTAPLRSMKPGFKPVDAIVQVKILKGAPDHFMVEFTVMQWCTLLRDKKIMCRAVTYRENQSAKADNLKPIVSELSNQFVINCLKANKK